LVVLGEVAAGDFAVIEGRGEAAREVFIDVLGEASGSGARGEDALDGVVLEGAEGARVAQRRAEIGRGEALAQRQDQASVVAGLSPLR